MSSRRSQKNAIESGLARYGFAVATTLAATFLALRLDPLGESPFYIFFAICVVTALYAGLGPAFVSIAASLLIVRFIFVGPYSAFTWPGDVTIEDAVRMIGFALLSLMVCSLAAASRRERNALKATVERYRVMTETAADGIILTDDHGIILFVNPHTQLIFGRSEPEMLGQSITEFVPENGCRNRLSQMRQSLDTRAKLRAIESVARHANGADIPIEISLGVYSDQGMNGFTAVIREITGRIRPPDSLEPRTVLVHSEKTS